MAFGGGSFITQNKVLPGVYVNVSAETKVSSEISDRGVAALGIESDWGADGEVFYVDESAFRKNSQALFGYTYTDDKLKGLRDLFLNLNGCYFYRLNSGTKAANSLCEAKCSGVRGNALQIVVTKTGDGYLVVTCLDGQEVDSQAVKSAADLQDNDYVCWLDGAKLTVSAGAPLSGGTNKDGVGVDEYQTMLDLLEGYQFNTLGCLSTESTVKSLFAQYTKEQREDSGRKFQTVLYDYAADYEGVISAANKVLDADFPESALVYWLTGAEAGCAVNATLTNAVYDGEFDVQPVLGQSKLQAALQGGKLVLHKLGNELRVLEDINSLVTVQAAQSEDMRYNQTMRVLDQIVADLSKLFYERYLGSVLNDNSGRISLWNDIVSYYRKLEGLRAIEDFDSSDIVVEQGENKKAVVISSKLTVINAMSQLYLSVIFE